ncbi:MAG: hypothetical protein DRQ48_00170 [Gammaproteobacteria bacterium]|nr:MAG: hypothetical protein DRQ48_00170 [Gammaproteobacteria bacterium]
MPLTVHPGGLEPGHGLLGATVFVGGVLDLDWGQVGIAPEAPGVHAVQAFLKRRGEAQHQSFIFVAHGLGALEVHAGQKALPKQVVAFSGQRVHRLKKKVGLGNCITPAALGFVVAHDGQLAAGGGVGGRVVKRLLAFLNVVRFPVVAVRITDASQGETFSAAAAAS